MRRYWIKITGGALAIFIVGMLLVRGVEGIHSRVHEMFNGSGDITIPLMGLIPLSVGDVQYGHLNKIQIHRDQQKQVTGITLVARLADSIDSDRFDDCDFTVRDASHIDEHSSFTCLDSIPEGMREFGSIRFVDEDGDDDLVRPLVLAEADIHDLQTRNGGQNRRINTDSIQAAAESAGQAARRMGDSIRRVMEERYGHRAPAAPGVPTAPTAPSAGNGPTPHAAPKSGRTTTVTTSPTPHSGS